MVLFDKIFKINFKYSPTYILKSFSHDTIIYDKVTKLALHIYKELV